MRVAGSKLITNMRRHAGLDPTRPQRNQPQSKHQPNIRITRQPHRRQRGMTRTIHQRQHHDRAVLADHRIGDQGPKQRRQIHRAIEEVHLLGRLDLTDPRPSGTAHVMKVLHHEHR